jgi:hypothetical protein
MDRNTVLAILIIGTIVLCGYAINQAYAYYPNPRDYPEAFPSFQYYDDKYVKAKAGHMIGWIPEPLPYFWINPLPETIQCDTWVEVTGHIPYDYGVLQMSAISQEKYGERNDDRHVLRANLSYQTQYELQNYINIPCNEDTLGEYLISFGYQPYPTIWNLGFIQSAEPMYQAHFDVDVTR